MPIGKTKHISETMVRLFGDLPVVEAKSRLLIVGKNRDASGAVRLDPKNCFLAKACNRLFDSSAVVFFRTVAYVDLPTARGRRRLVRFALPLETRKSIARFDTTGEISAGGYEMLPPSPSQSLDQKITRRREHARKAVISGTSRPARPEKIVTSGAIGEIRNGVGMVHFSRGKETQK